LVAEGIRAEAAGRFVEACDRYQQALRILPGHGPAYLNLGIALEGAGDARSARQAYLSTLEVDPGNPYAHFNLGKLLHAAGNDAEAARQLQAALERKADFTDARVVLASVLEAQGDAEGALEMLRRAVRERPDYAGAWFNYALLLQKLDRVAEAEAAMRRTLELWPDRADVWLREGELLKLLQRLPESEAALRRTLAMDARLSGAYRLLASILLDQLRIEEALQVLAAGHEFDTDGHTRACELFMLNFHEGISAEALFERHKAFGDEVESRHQPFTTFAGSRDPERKLRIGYISGDFRAHPVGWGFLPLVENHDRSRHDVYCYSLFAAADDVTRRIARNITRWHDVTPLSTEQLANVIHTDRIDILVDLSGYGGISPIDVLASRPAPVQASWLGYLSTSGMKRIDYRITDAFADPPGDADRFHTEKLLRLPHSQWCYRPPATADPVAAPPCTRNGFFTFGSFNQAAKLSPAVRRLWAEILKRTPGSKLLVVGVPPGPATQLLVEEFSRAGIDPSRVAIEPRRLLEDYFKTLRSVDVALDTLPYSGGTTTCDILWMGTPVLTLPGSRSVSRSACSILGTLGMREWMASSPEDYVAKAVRAAGDSGWLAEQRRSLRDRMRASPLMDEARFARDMEALYRQMWRTWCAAPS
jgi:predicted O-linked N-acetylglucosamine transferase (SPINDLY family)